MKEILDKEYYGCEISFLTYFRTYRVKHLKSLEVIHTSSKKDAYRIARLMELVYAIEEQP